MDISRNTEVAIKSCLSNQSADLPKVKKKVRFEILPPTVFCFKATEILPLEERDVSVACEEDSGNLDEAAEDIELLILNKPPLSSEENLLTDLAFTACKRYIPRDRDEEENPLRHHDIANQDDFSSDEDEANTNQE